MRLFLHQNWRNLRNLALLLISSTDHSSPFAVTRAFCLTQASLKILVQNISHQMRALIFILIVTYTNSLSFLGVMGFL